MPHLVCLYVSVSASLLHCVCIPHSHFLSPLSLFASSCSASTSSGLRPNAVRLIIIAIIFSLLLSSIQLQYSPFLTGLFLFHILFLLLVPFFLLQLLFFLLLLLIHVFLLFLSILLFLLLHFLSLLLFSLLLIPS